MPAGWMHAVVDLIAYNRPYLEIHQWKDAPSRWLGTRHRAERHDWYNAGKAGIWSLDNPTPSWIDDAIRTIGEAHGDEAAEQYMVDLSHDHWDRLWDESPPRDRLLIEGFFAWVLFRPDILQAKFSVNVERGRIQRQIDGVLRWEDHPSVLRPYRQLCQYVRRVLDNNPVLREVVAGYVDHESRSPILSASAGSSRATTTAS